MTLTKADVRDVIDAYIKAWEGQDPDRIVEIFTEDGTYHERVLKVPMRGHDGIRRYWQSKVVESQANITCNLLSLYLDGNTAVAEWEAWFDDLEVEVRKHMKEVAILEFRGTRIASLREYWAAEAVPEL